MKSTKLFIDGLHRLPYALLTMLFAMLFFAADHSITLLTQSIEIRYAVSAIPLMLWIPCLVLRLVNMGYSGWYALLFGLPYVNLLVFHASHVIPARYAEHEQLDSTAKKMIVTTLSLLVLLFVLSGLVIGGGLFLISGITA